MVTPPPFYFLDRKDYYPTSLVKSVQKGIISQADADIIQIYVNEKVATHNISKVRITKIYTVLIFWKKHLIPNEYQRLTTPELFSAIPKLISKDYKQNTQHDYIAILKSFLLWLIENEYNTTLNEKKVRAISAPSINTNTTHPDDILNPEDITKMITACRSSRDRAIIAVQYEAATRIGELARLRWKDVLFDEYGAKLHITDTKTNKIRISRITEGISCRYLSTWRADYPGTPEGDSFVFITERKDPMQYVTIIKVFKNAAERAGIDKRVHTHLFRKSRITHLIEQGLPIPNLVEMAWANQNTKMIGTYVKISSNQQDRVMLKHMGVLDENENKKQERRLSGGVCPVCHSHNAPTDMYCAKCGIALTDAAEIKQQILKEVSQKQVIYQNILANIKK